MVNDTLSGGPTLSRRESVFRPDGKDEERVMSLDQPLAPVLAPARSVWPIVGIVTIGLAALVAGLTVYGAAQAPKVARHAVQMSGTESNASARPRAVQHPIACEK